MRVRRYVRGWRQGCVAAAFFCCRSVDARFIARISIPVTSAGMPAVSVLVEWVLCFFAKDVYMRHRGSYGALNNMN